MTPKKSPPKSDSLAPLRRNLVNWVLAFVFLVSMVFLYYASESRVEIDSGRISVVDQTLNGDYGELSAKLGVAMTASSNTVVGFTQDDKDLAGVSSRGYTEQIESLSSFESALGSVESRTRGWDRIFDRLGYQTIDVASNDSLLSLSDEAAGYSNGKIYCQTRARVLEESEDNTEISAEAGVYCVGISELEWQSELSDKIVGRTQIASVAPLFHVDEETVTNSGIWRRASGNLYELKKIGDLAVQVENPPTPINYYRRSSDLTWFYGYGGGSLPRCSELSNMSNSDITDAFSDFGCFDNNEQITTIDEYSNSQ